MALSDRVDLDPTCRQRRLLTRTALLLVGVAFAVALAHTAFRPGYVLEVDTSWGPHSPTLDYGFYLPVAVVVRIATLALGGATTGKVYLVGTLTLCAVAPMIALRKLSLWIRVLCGAIGLFNPWVYERIVEGQWTVVAAGASLFLWLAAIDRLDDRPDAFGAVLVALCGVLVVALSPGFLAMLIVLAVARVALGSRGDDRSGAGASLARARRRWTRTAIVFTAGLLLYGVVLFAFGHGAESIARVHSFGGQDLDFFRSQSQPLGLPIRLLGFAGFWAERTARFEPLDAGWAVWPVGAFALAGAAFAGALRNRERSWLLFAGLVGLLISASTAIAPIRSVIDGVGRHFPVLLGFREPEKFSALWLLATVSLVGVLLSSLQDRDRASAGLSWRAPIVAAGLIAAVIGLGAGREPGLLADALRPVKYPADWYEAAAYMRQHPTTGPIAVLPWHHYLPLPFAGGRIVQNPADVFFPGDILVSQDPEIGLAPSGAGADIDADIERAASESSSGCQLASALRTHGVREVVVVPILEGRGDLSALERCGYERVEGHTSTVAVARDTGS